jgi:glycosyltransferase involved in cell wall biosynthesis
MGAFGVSLVVCTHNGAARVPPTLAHLAVQQVPAGLAWEILVVDNASTDDGAAVARDVWPGASPAPLRIVIEPRLGVGYARTRGLEESAYDVVGFVDDDNWLAPDWVATAAEVMRARPRVGACGSAGEPVGEARALPPWFAANAQSYAVGAQGDPGDVTVWPGNLWGAGLAVRRPAWQALCAAGFAPILVGRHGPAMTAGEDTELCFALVAAGWRLWFEPRLRFRHALAPARLEWTYLRRAHRGYGVTSATMDHYYLALDRRRRLLRPLLAFWTWRWLSALLRWGWHTARAGGEGSAQALRSEFYRGRLRGLLEARVDYRATGRRVRAMLQRLGAGAPS